MKELSHEAIELLDSWVAEDKSNRMYEFLIDCNKDIYEIKFHWTFVCKDLGYSKSLVSSLRLSDMRNMIGSSNPTDQDQRHDNSQDNIDKTLPIMLDLKLDLMKIKIESANGIVKKYVEAVRQVNDLLDRLKPLTKLNDAMHKIAMVNAVNALSNKSITASSLTSLVNIGALNAPVADNDVLKPIKDVIIQQLDDALSFVIPNQ